MIIDAQNLHYQKLNELIKSSGDDHIQIDACMGQRYIGAGLSGKTIEINGVPGNALGCYMDNSVIRVKGNSQDATGDTMNEGAIYIYGSAGDATGYGMRGGKIYIKGNTGYRAGIHMKAYQEHVPVIIVGGVAGSFLGEYQAGGKLIVLGLEADGKPLCGDFCGTGMHGGKIYMRCDKLHFDVPKQLNSRNATEEDLSEIEGPVMEFCEEFGYNKKEIMDHNFVVLTPNTKNPYKQLYNNH